MLRGVNKNIIEIVETENQYFEKAILFVRPAAKEQGGDLLRQKAVEYLSAVQPHPRPPDGGAVQTKVRLSPWVKVGVGVAVLLLAAMLVFL